MVNRVGSFLSGRHFIAEDVNAISAPSAFGRFGHYLFVYPGMTTTGSIL
jgi:hypothetical protein